jgi:hypothetical protein
VINEFGFVSLNPNNPMEDIDRHTGFAEMHLGPKWTFYRNDQNQTVAAGGLTFILPTGSNRVAQNTGNLGLDPYLTVAHTFGRLPSGYGSFNLMSTTGYTFGVDSQRSEFLHSSLHLDYNIANANKIYPLIELNWFHYTKAGRARDVNFEGVDMANFGASNLANKDFVSLAVGARYKFTENFQTGLTAEFPVSSNKQLTDFRVTWDFIFRY